MDWVRMGAEASDRLIDGGVGVCETFESVASQRFVGVQVREPNVFADNRNGDDDNGSRAVPT